MIEIMINGILLAWLSEFTYQARYTLLKDYLPEIWIQSKVN